MLPDTDIDTTLVEVNDKENLIYHTNWHYGRTMMNANKLFDNWLSRAFAKVDNTNRIQLAEFTDNNF